MAVSVTDCNRNVCVCVCVSVDYRGYMVACRISLVGLVFLAIYPWVVLFSQPQNNIAKGEPASASLL